MSHPELQSGSLSAATLEDLFESLSLNELADRIVGSGLLTQREFDALCLEAGSTGKRNDTSIVAKALLESQRLSLYQLWLAAHGHSDQLTLGEYTVVEPIGAGGMGEVLLAVHRRMNRRVAIKFLPSRFVENEDMLKRFQREVQVAARLNHPNIVTAYDAGEIDDLHFLVMEYVDGCDLASLINHAGPLPLNDALRCVIQAGQGVHYAHQQGVIHRDLKPSNLLLDRQGMVKVLDMGLARWHDQSNESTAAAISMTGNVMGTVDYMSPEQAKNARMADERSDQYSLACTLFALVHGRPVFSGETVVETLLAHQSGEIPELVEETEGPGPSLNSVFQRMMAKDPSARYESLLEACEALREHLPADEAGLEVVRPLPQRSEMRSHATRPTRSMIPERSLHSTMTLGSQDLQALADASAGGRRSRRALVGIIGLGLLGVLLFLGLPVILKLATPDGVLAVKCHVEGALVEVDGKRLIRITDPKTDKEYAFDLAPGTHEVRVTLADGTVLQSESITIRSKSTTLFEVDREDPVAGQRVKKGESRAPPVKDDDPNVLTVAQDGSAEYTSLTQALEAVRPHQVIRIVDGATYEETVYLNGRRYEGVTLESTGQATWRPQASMQRTVLVMSVPDLTIRQLRFGVAMPNTMCIVVGGTSSGLIIEDCRFEREQPFGPPFVSLEGIQVAKDRPLIVRRNTFERGSAAIQLSGVQDDGDPMTCGRILICECQFENSQQAIYARGALHDIWIVGNRMQASVVSGVQFMHLQGAPTNLVVANNTWFDCMSPFRLWESGNVQADVRVLANVSLYSTSAPEKPMTDSWLVIDGRGNERVPKGVGDGAWYSKHWTFARNFREGEAPKPDSQYGAGWIPASKTSRLLPWIEVMSRDRDSEDFLRPLADSELAKGGWGEPFPAYVGAVAPRGLQPFDWEAAFLQSMSQSESDSNGEQADATQESEL